MSYVPTCRTCFTYIHTCLTLPSYLPSYLGVFISQMATWLMSTCLRERMCLCVLRVYMSLYLTCLLAFLPLCLTGLRAYVSLSFMCFRAFAFYVPIVYVPTCPWLYVRKYLRFFVLYVFMCLRALVFHVLTTCVFYTPMCVYSVMCLYSIMSLRETRTRA